MHPNVTNLIHDVTQKDCDVIMSVTGHEAAKYLCAGLQHKLTFLLLSFSISTYKRFH